MQSKPWMMQSLVLNDTKSSPGRNKDNNNNNNRENRNYKVVFPGCHGTQGPRSTS